MLNSSAQNNKVSLPLASLAYQMFVQTSSAGWGSTDDCTTINAYLIGRAKLEDLRQRYKRTDSRPSLDDITITSLLIGIHTAAAVEALKFAKRLGIDPAVVRTAVKGAAGYSVIFDKVCAQFQLQAEVSLDQIKNFDVVLEGLVSFYTLLLSRVSF
jgi:3-hydroxyisobutyrate dehydrogenase-like beta-hydroxyacid dehydrogenase